MSDLPAWLSDRAISTVAEDAVASSIKPDEAAEQITISRDMGVPRSVIAEDPDAFRRRQEQQRIARELRGRTALPEWLSDPDNAVLAKDDVPTLGWFESLPGAIERGGRRALAGAQGVPSLGQAGTGITRDDLFDRAEELDPSLSNAEIAQALDLDPQSLNANWAVWYVKAGPEGRERLRERNRTMVEETAEPLAAIGEELAAVAEIPMSSAASRFRDTFFEAEQASLGDIVTMMSADPGGALAFLTETAAESLPALAASAATTAVTGSPAAGVGLMASSSTFSESIGEIDQFLAEKGADTQTPEGWLEILNNPDLLQEAQDRGVTRGVIIGALDAISGGVAGRALAQSPLGDVVLQSLSQAALGAGGEAMAQFANDGEIDLREVVVEGLAEFVTAPIEVLGVAGRRLGKDASRASGAGETAITLQEIDQKAAQSALRGRAPARFQDFIDRTGLANLDLTVPAQDLQTFFQANDLSPDAFDLDADAFSEALISGGDAQIPASVYAGKIAGTELAPWFHENATLDADEMSLSEAARFNTEWQDELLVAWEAQRTLDQADLEARSGDIQVRDAIFGQLRAAGRSPDVATRESQVWGAFFRTMADRYGEDSLDLAQQFGVRVEGPEQSRQNRVRNNLDISLNTLRKTGGRSPKSESLMQFVIGLGGLQDRGGDIAGIGGPSTLISETADEMAQASSLPRERRGVGIDDAARRAVEEGYFPDLAGSLESADQVEADLVPVLVEALRSEVAGTPTFRANEGPDETLAALMEEIERRGLSLGQTNDEIIQALEGRSFDQAPVTESKAFKEWFGDSKVVDEDGKPLVVYHSTTPLNATGGNANFDAFHPMSHFGSAEAANERLTESGLKSFSGAHVLPVYLSIQNPVEIADNGIPHTAIDIAIELQEKVGFSEDVIDIIDGGADEAARLQRLSDALSDVGVDGLFYTNIYEDAGSVSWVANSPEQIKSVHNAGSFSADDSRILHQQARGSVTFPAEGVQNGETVIRLMEGADLSTFLHESGHFFLEAFRSIAEREDAPQAIKDDLAVVNEWIGHQSGAYGTDAQEKWARGFEAYLLEGKAPSLDLADAFSRFKAWLTRIYRTALGLNVSLTPDVRAVMDRMLATDQEITSAREEMEMRPLFSDAKVVGMSDAEFRPYQRMARRSAEEASQRLLDKTMARVRRETEGWYRAEKKAVREEVEISADTRREYRLIEILANQKWIGEGEPGGIPDFQIDRAALVDRFGEGVLAELSRARLGGKRAIYGKGGESPDIIAETFGFSGADEMIRVLQNTIKRKDFISEEVDRIMLERHGDPLNDGTIEEEALRAVHSDQQAHTVAAEARQLAKRTGRDTRNITARVFRQRARAMLGRMEVRRAIRPAQFLTAERQHARSAQKAFSDIAAGRGNPEENLVNAGRYKEQQLLNHYLYLESRDLEQEVRRGREKMRAYSKKSVRKKLEGDYIEQIDNLLETYEFRQVSQKELARRASLSDYVERMTAEGRGAELAIDQRLIDNAERVHYSHLSADQLRGLFDTVSNIDHMGRFKQSLIDAKEKRDLEETVGLIVGQVRENIGTGKADENRGAKGKIRNALNLLWSVDTIAIEYDGGEEVGTFYEQIKRRIDVASAEEQRMSVELAEKMGDLFAVYSASEIADMKKERHVEGANGHSWSKLEVISAALNTGNTDNLERLLNDSVYEKRRLSPGQLDTLLATLDKRDWDFVQSMWDLVNSYWPELEKVEKRRTGVAPIKVEARPVETPFGIYRGGYYPISYDSSVPGATIVDEQSAFDRFTSAGHGARAAVKNGMVKAREQTGGGRTLKFDMTVPMAHLRDTIRLITLSEAVDGTHRVLNHGGTRDAFIDAGRQDDWRLLNLWLKDVAEGPIYNSDFVNSLARTIKNNFTLSRLAFNLKTIGLQVTGLGQAAATIGKRRMLSGMVTYGKDMAGTVDMVMEKSTFMAERQTSFQKDIHDFANDVKVSSPVAGRYSKGIDFISKLGFWPIQKTQFYVVDVPTWIGAYQAEAERSGNDDKAVNFADRMVARSQASGLMSDRAAIERGTLSETTRQSDMVRIWTALGSYMLAKMNRGRVEIGRTARDLREAESVGERVATVLDSSANLFLLYVFEAVLMALAYDLYDEDDEDGEFAEFVMAETASALVGGVPFVRDAVGAAKGFDGGGVFGAGLSAAGNMWIQLEQGENDRQLRRAVGDMVGVSTGLPTTQSLRLIEGALDNDKPAAEALFGSNPLNY